MAKAHSHFTERTSPYGQPYIGRCVLCGAEGLSLSETLDDCPAAMGDPSEIVRRLIYGPEPNKGE